MFVAVEDLCLMIVIVFYVNVNLVSRNIVPFLLSMIPWVPWVVKYF